MIYLFYLKILDFRYCFLRLFFFKKLVTGLAITRFFKKNKHKNHVAKKPVSSGRMGIEAVFISDLHLHPEEPHITSQFESFISWAGKNVRAVYILGDFFHVWAGDDNMNAWAVNIGKNLAKLAEQDISVYFMHGNRDFLLGKQFAASAKFTILKEPAVIQLGEKSILLVHGDRYCLNDKGHQLLRRITRNRIFSALFLSLPCRLRKKIVYYVRHRSQTNIQKPYEHMQVVSGALIKHMQKLNVDTVIHGHTHQPGLTTHKSQGKLFHQYVLSDWDDTPLLLCYDKSIGLYFNRLEAE